MNKRLFLEILDITSLANLEKKKKISFTVNFASSLKMFILMISIFIKLDFIGHCYDTVTVG